MPTARSAPRSHVAASIRNLSLGGVALACCAILVAGCSSSASTPSSTSAATTTPRSSVAPEPPTTFPSYKNNAMLRADVSITSCVASTGGWTATGAIHNTEKSGHAFVITVYFTDPQSTVLAGGKTSVPVRRGGTATWHVTAKFAAMPGTRCVVVGVD